MALLALGLALFLGIHLLPVATPLRDRIKAKLGDGPYRGLFSLVSIAGLVLIVVGYRAAGRGEPLFAPSPAAIAVAPYAVTLAFVLFAAANLRSHLRGTLQHPMLLGLLIWAGVHFAANGDARGTLLFGAFFAYAVVDLAAAIKRRAVKVFEPVARHDVIAVVAGVAVALIVMAFHRALFGVAVVPFGV